MKSDFGHFFGATSHVTMRYDSDARRLYFSTNESNFALAFDSLPCEVLYPAVSLYQKDDKVHFCTATSCGKNRDSGDENTAAREKLFSGVERGLVSYFSTISDLVLLILDAYEASSEKSTRESCLTHPLIRTLFPSLIAALLNDGAEGASFRLIFQLLPSLIILSRRISKIYESEEDGGGGTVFGPVDGKWLFKCSSGGPSLPAQEYEVALECSTMRLLDPGEDKDQDYGRPLHVHGSGMVFQSRVFYVGTYFNVGSSSAMNVEIEGNVFGTRLCLKETWANGGISEISARISLDWCYFTGKFIELKTGAIGTIEGERIECRLSAPLIKGDLFKLSLLLCNACGCYIAELIRFPDANFRAIEALKEHEGNTAIVEEADLTEMGGALDSSSTPKKWENSDLFSGGLQMYEGVSSFIQEFVEAFGLPNTAGHRWWQSLCLNFVSFDFPSPSYFESSLLDGIRKGCNSGKIIDDYVIHHTGSYALKIGGPSFSDARKAVLCSLIQHTGCTPICNSEIALIIKSIKGLSDRPNLVLVEVWRTCNRVLEHYIRLKQVSGADYESSAQRIMERSMLLSKITPQAAVMLLASAWASSGAPEKENQLVEEVSVFLNELLEYFTQPICNVSEIKSYLLRAAVRGAMRIAGLKTFSLIFESACLAGCSCKNATPISSIPLQSTVISHVAYSLLGIPRLLLMTTSLSSNDWNPVDSCHYADELKGMPAELSSIVKTSFEAVYEYVAQFILRSTWAGDRDSQMVGLASWALRILPADHAFLNKINIFRVLQTVLDNSRNTMIVKQDSSSLEPDVFRICMNADRRLSRLSLIIVHSLASQVATSSENNLQKSFPIISRTSLVRVMSGPDTLSLSLFDMLYTELYIGLKQVIASAVRPSELLEDWEHELSSDLRSLEKYMYRILNLLCSVSSSSHCLRAMTSPKWVTLLLDTIGCGGLSLQRKLLQTLLPILLSMEPSSFSALIGGLYGSREEIIYSSSELSDSDIEANIDSASYSRSSIPERLFCLLFEGINVPTPLLTLDGQYKYSKIMEHIEANRTAECISSNCLLIIRNLAANPKWQENIYAYISSHAFDSVRWEEPNYLLSVTATFSILGGSNVRLWEGARVNVNNSKFSRESDIYSSRWIPSSHCTGYFLHQSDSQVEVAVRSGGNMSFNHAFGLPQGDQQIIRVLRLNEADVTPVSHSSLKTFGQYTPELYGHVVQFVSNICLPFLTTLFTGVQEPEDPHYATEDLKCRRLTAVVAALKAVSMSSAAMVGLVSSPAAFEKLISIAMRMASTEELLPLSFLEKRWTKLLDSFFLRRNEEVLPAREKSPRPVELATATDSDISPRPESHSMSTRLGIPGHLSPAGLLSALGMGTMGMMSNSGREADPQAVEQMVEMGIAKEWAEFALRRCRNNVEIAINMCFEHGTEMAQLVAEDAALQQSQAQRGYTARRSGSREGDSNDRRLDALAPTIAQFLNHSVRRTAESNEIPSLLRPLVDLGFPLSWCQRAMDASGNNIDSALGWILANGDRLMASESEPSRPAQDNLFSSYGPLSVIGGNAAISENFLCRGTSSGFPTVGCKGYAAMSGKWFYECTVITAGCCQIGWADVSFEGTAADGKGVGDDGFSWAYDGYRSMLWHGYCETWGSKWKMNDIIGCYVDLDHSIMSFYLNGQASEAGMGEAFTSIDYHGGLYPAASFNRGGKHYLFLESQ